MYREKGKFFEAYLHAEEVIQLVTMNATCQNLSCVERVKPDKKNTHGCGKVETEKHYKSSGNTGRTWNSERRDIEYNV